MSPVGPPMFHPRGIGPRGMRPGLRPQYGPRGSGGGPPFDSRGEGEAPFYRTPFDDNRGGPPSSGHMRPPQYGGSAGGGPPMTDGPWRNQENGPPGVWMNMEGNNGIELDELGRENQMNQRDIAKGHGNKHQDRDKDNRNSRNRKSRWGNASPSPSDHNTDVTASEQDCEDDRKPTSENDVDVNQTFRNDDNPDAKLNSDEIPPVEASQQVLSESPQEFVEETDNASANKNVDNSDEINPVSLANNTENLPSEQFETKSDKVEVNEFVKCKDFCRQESDIQPEVPATIENEAPTAMEVDQVESSSHASEQVVTENTDEML